MLAHHLRLFIPEQVSLYLSFALNGTKKEALKEDKELKSSTLPTSRSELHSVIDKLIVLPPLYPKR